MTTGTSQRVTLGDVLAIAPADDRLPDPALALIIGAWGERAAEDVAAMTPFTAARELLAVMPDPREPDGDDPGAEGYDNAARFAAAEAVLALLKRGGFTPAPAPAAAAVPPRMVVEIPESPAEMSWRKLLPLLAEDPGRDQELRPYLHVQPQYRTAHERTAGALAFKREGGGLDAEMTIAYIDQVSRPHAKVQGKFRGHRPVTLGVALGLEERPVFHPFTAEPVSGPDSNGFDFGELPAIHPGLNEALRWARETGHSAWPQAIDLYTFSEEVFRKPLPRRWQLILDDYNAAIADGDEAAKAVSRYWSATRPSSGRPAHPWADDGYRAAAPAFPGGGYAPAPDYQRLVEQKAALSGSLIESGSGNDYRGGVYETVRTSGSGLTFRNVVVTEGGLVSGSGCDGTFLCPPGVRLRVSGSGNSVRQQNMTWHDLAVHIGVA